ncbi:MAG: pyridoxamine 5'-phosphate oxidase [Bacteroidetes bacterium]|nr:MAG: pyridoxamine 5'-phosphate oxidase [Bacteroidota bacterium]
MFGELNSGEIELVLHEQIIGRIGCHVENMTYVVPISYAYDGSYVYAHTQEGLKIHMMRKNPNVCFEVDSTKDMADWRSVICWGDFEELTKDKERKEGLDKLHARVLPLITSDTTKLSPEWPFAPTEIGLIKGIVFRIKLTKKTGRFEKSTLPSFLGLG